MAATIKTKIRTTTGGTASTTAGELCVNTFDKKIFIGDGAATVDLFGNLATTAGKLSQFAATTSAELAGVVSDETGSGVLVFGTSPSISTLAISTTGSTNKAAAINMASGVTSTTVNSTITLNGYSSFAPTIYQGVISSGPSQGYDLKLYGQGVAFIGINTDTMYLGDVDGAGLGGVISLDGVAGTVDITGILSLTTGIEVSVSGKVLTCMDGAGTAEWQTPAAGTPDYVLFNLGII